MTQEAFILDVDDLPDVGDDQITTPVQVGFPTGWDGNLATRLDVVKTGAADTANPVVDNYSPAVGSTVNEADPIFFDVTDDSGQFASIIVAIKQGGRTEQVHDGSTFLAPYLDLSSRSNKLGGFRYRVRRTGGWIDTVVQSVSAVDSSGNVAV